MPKTSTTPACDHSTEAALRDPLGGSWVIRQWVDAETKRPIGDTIIICGVCGKFFGAIVESNRKPKTRRRSAPATLHAPPSTPREP